MPTLAGFAQAIPRGLPRLYYLEPDASDLPISLGTCVRVSLSGAHSRRRMLEEGVVIEVVPPDTEVRSARVVRLRVPIADEPRYVIQCWSRRVLRHASDLLVVTP